MNSTSESEGKEEGKESKVKRNEEENKEVERRKKLTFFTKTLVVKLNNFFSVYIQIF